LIVKADAALIKTFTVFATFFSESTRLQQNESSPNKQL